MSTRKRVKAHQNLRKQIMNWFLRRLLVIARRVRLSRSGFVLPTVAMVLLVVVLLTTALLIRAFDRSTYATNFRANQAVLIAAAPAIDRAKAKIDALFDDSILPRATPSDVNLYNLVKTNPKYTFGDETRLKLAQEFNNQAGIQGNTNILENDETLTTAWKFPIDTDDNGKFDTFTLYGIYFRSPSRASTGKFNRPRNPLEARTPPMDEGALGRQCSNQLGTSASLVGNSSWYKSSGKLKKSIFVFVATVPNTNRSDANYEHYKGNKGFYGLEFQQDRSRIPVNNNAVWFEDDLELTPDTPFRLNGKVVTNANLLAGGHDASVQFYQVSSKYSCFYREENSKITVGGNVGTGSVADSTDQTSVTVDLFSNYSNGSNPLSQEINSTHKSTTSTGGSLIAYNDAAYNQRIALMEQTALSASYCQEGGSPCSQTNPPQKSTVLAITQYPADVKKGFADRVQVSGLNTYDVLAEEIEIYFRNRTRRVPYAEISSPDGTNAKSPYDSDGDNIDTGVFSSSPLEPPTVWREPTNTNTNLTLDTAQLVATWPKQQRYDGKETLLGDRVFVGNNLPAFWSSDYVTGQQQQLNSNWTNPSNEPRYRTTQVKTLDNLGISNRDDFWEEKAAENPNAPFANVGGLRVITGAGIYRNQSATIAALSTPSFMYPPSLDGGGAIPNAPQLAGEGTATQYTLVWPDTMPMSGANDPVPPDLRMRATAVYHYTQSSGNNQAPIACVSSYYDPTNATTAKNKVGVNGGYGIDTVNGRSNNGVVYPAPYSATGRFSAIATYLTELKSQAKMMFPNGRIVNEPLQKALQKLSSTGTIADSTKPLNLSENSAIDTTICSLKILDGSIGNFSTVIPHGAIKEASFLDAREVKALNKTASNYDLELEQRQPLEIRVTEINLSTDNTQGITRKTIGTNEYLLPNSGIIYASRDDALPDTSNKSNAGKLLSPTDFILDATRRPNGIRLINGSNLARRSDNADREEKGLILATNLAVYIKGNFNLHRQPGGSADIEEFTDKLESDWSDFYTRAAIDSHYACRPGKMGCPTTNGDTWRSATIIADAVTLLSGSFQDGFRNQGDYDLRNNAGTSVTQARKQNGFWDNSFVTSALWWNTSNTDHAYPAESTNSYVSYLTNGVTPIQRRLDFPEYLMEYCPKVPVSACQTADWVINTSGAKATYAINQDFAIGTHQAGTTAQAASSHLERYARRVAFKRKSDHTLELTQWSNGEVTPIPLGINTGGKVDQFPYDTYSTKAPRSADNALWFRTTSNTSGKPYNDANYGANQPLFYLDNAIATTQQPSLVPVLQIHTPEGAPASSLSISGSMDKWIQQTNTDTTFNAAFVSGNSPSQPNEESAGLHNFVRFLQKWDATANIKGSFVQLQRSAYATAPFAPIKADQVNANNGSLSIFAYSPTKYPAGGTPTGTLTYYTAPTRQWGFDVGLLSQSPDLFAQTFTQPAIPSKEFFREISRDDPWVQTLLCAAEASDRIGAAGATYTQYTVPNKNQRPAGCQSDTANYPANPS